MPQKPGDHRRQADKLDRDITRLVSAFEADLADAWGVLRQRIVRLVNQLEAEQGKVISTQVNLGVARRVATELQAAIEEAGYRELIQDALTEMGELAKYQGLGQTRVARVQREAAWSAETLDAFHDLKLRELLQVPDAVISKVEQTLLRGVIGAQDRAELLNELVAQLELTLPQVRTIYDTALNEFSQIAVLSTTDGSPDEAFLYDGPIDALMRTFCADRVGKLYTRAVIDEMDNGQLDNTLITRGGYNCRHKWIPIDKASELYRLANTGKFANEEYEREVQASKEAKAQMKADKAAKAAARAS